MKTNSMQKQVDSLMASNETLRYDDQLQGKFMLSQLLEFALHTDKKINLGFDYIDLYGFDGRTLVANALGDKYTFSELLQKVRAAI